MPSFREVLAGGRRRLASTAGEDRQRSAGEARRAPRGISSREAGADLDLEWVSQRRAGERWPAELRRAPGRFRRSAQVPQPLAPLLPPRAGAGRAPRPARCSRGRSTGWPRAACTTGSAGASTATRWTADWLVPHFEKMLYDNALLARVYGQAGLAFGRSDWVEVARGDRRLPAARDAGAGRRVLLVHRCRQRRARGAVLHLDRATQIRAGASPEQARLLVTLLRPRAQGQLRGRGQRPAPCPRPREEPVASRDRPASRGERSRGRGATAGGACAGVVPPATDDKRLAGWNGMAVWSLAWLGAALPEPALPGGGRTGRPRSCSITSSADGRLAAPGATAPPRGTETLEDVAWVSAGPGSQLYEADGDVRLAVRREGPHRPPACRTTRAPRACSSTLPTTVPSLIMRPRNPTDGATPSAAGMLVATLLRLSALTEDDVAREAAERALRAEAAVVARIPATTTTLVQAAEIARRPPNDPGRGRRPTVGVHQGPARRGPAGEAGRLRARPLPICAGPGGGCPRSAAFLRPRECRGRPARAYLCEGGACRLPVEDPEALSLALSAMPG